MILVLSLLMVSVGHACPTDCPATKKDDDGCCPEKPAPKPVAPKKQVETAPRPEPWSSVVAAHGAKIVAVPGGRTTLGCTPGAGACESNEKPSRTLVMHSFEMMDREVSQELWAAVMGFNPMESRTQFYGGAEQDPCSAFSAVSLVGEALPVACIDWCDAVELANRLSLAEGFAETELAYSGVEQCRATAGASVRWNKRSGAWRMPTEQEWEHAARGGRDSQWGQADPLSTNPCGLGNIADRDAKAKFNFADTESCSDDVAGLRPEGISRYPVFSTGLPPGLQALQAIAAAERGRQGPEAAKTGGAGPRPEVISRYPANGYGLRDMVGNVWEWTWDVYGPYPATSSSSYSGVDSNAGSSANRVIRGGGWFDPARRARAAFRVGVEPAHRGVSLGLRLVRGACV